MLSTEIAKYSGSLAAAIRPGDAGTSAGAVSLKKIATDFVFEWIDLSEQVLSPGFLFLNSAIHIRFGDAVALEHHDHVDLWNGSNVNSMVFLERNSGTNLRLRSSHD